MKRKTIYVFDARRNARVFKTTSKRRASIFLRGYRQGAGSGRLEYKKLGKKDY